LLCQLAISKEGRGQTRNLPPMLPDHELDTLLITVTDAVDLARAGDVAEGYTALLAGLHRAKEVAAAGEPWAGELVSRYREALENFAREWRVGGG
jgi:hypothetical protein